MIPIIIILIFFLGSFSHIVILTPLFKKGKLIKSGSMKEIKGDKSLENVFMELEEK